jgi:hypothetical protein
VPLRNVPLLDERIRVAAHSSYPGKPRSIQLRNRAALRKFTRLEPRFHLVTAQNFGNGCCEQGYRRQVQKPPPLTGPLLLQGDHLSACRCAMSHCSMRASALRRNSSYPGKPRSIQIRNRAALRKVTRLEPRFHLVTGENFAELRERLLRTGIPATGPKPSTAYRSASASG